MGIMMGRAAEVGEAGVECYAGTEKNDGAFKRRKLKRATQSLECRSPGYIRQGKRDLFGFQRRIRPGVPFERMTNLPERIRKISLVGFMPQTGFHNRHVRHVM